MTTINDIADLARILRKNPEWAEAIRSLVLSRELLELPEKLSEFTTLANRNLETNMGRMQTSINRIQGRLDNGFGMNYELKVEKNLGSIASQHMNVRRVRVLTGVHTGRTPEYADMIEGAEDRGLITREQSEDLQRLDLVFRGQRRGEDSPTLVAAEVSITIGDSDIDRAASRGSLLEQACQMPVLTAVVGTRIDEERTILAAANGVAVILVPDE